MQICFILPVAHRTPVGGYKIAFEYANRLSDAGHKVSLLFLNDELLAKYHLPKFVDRELCRFLTKIRPNWFSLNKRINKISSLDKEANDAIHYSDVLIFTAVETVLKLWHKVSKINCKKVYFIQDYENWNVLDEKCQETYGLGMTNIVISKWLKDIVDEFSRKPSILIRNPIDLSLYKVNVLPDERKLHTIGVLYHTMPHKGFKYALLAVKKLKEKYSDLEVYIFGVYEKPKGLPSYCTYLRGASQYQTVEIYNKVSVWLCATVDEGFGLTGLEAMACGDVLVSTAYTGVFEYAKDGYNALLSPVKDVDALVKNVGRVFEDGGLREKLVQNAQDSVKAFDWNLAVDKFEEMLND